MAEHGSTFSAAPFKSMRREWSAVKRHWAGDWFGMGMVKKYPGTVLYATMYTVCYSIVTSSSFGYKYASEFTQKVAVDPDCPVTNPDCPFRQVQVWTVTTSFLSGGLTGLIMGVVCGQPLVVYGQTGPILLLYSYVYKLSEIFQPEGEDSIFPAFVAWVGLFSAIMHWAMAIFNINDLKNKITPFTDNIFACLVAGDFITTAVMGFAAGFGGHSPGAEAPSIFVNGPKPKDADQCLAINGFFTLLLGILFYVLTVKFGGLQTNCKWSSVRMVRLISNYAVLWAMVLLVIFSYIPSWWPFPGFAEHGDIIPARIPAGKDWGGVGNLFGESTENPSPYAPHDYVPFLKMGVVPGPAIGLSVIFAFMLTMLFYVDQNVSTIFACNGDPWGKVKAPECYNYDFFWLGVTVLITGFMGIPATSGLIPQNPMHTRALSVVEEDCARQLLPEGRETEGTPSLSAASVPEVKPEQVIVVEQRVSALIHSAVLFIMMFLMPIISLIPIGLLWGGYLLLASEAIGTGFVQRILGCLSSSNMREALADKEGVKDILDSETSYGTMCKYTMVQFSFWLILYVIGVFLKELAPYDKDHKSNIWVMLGMFFPLIVMLYAIPLRSHILPMMFSLEDLDVLDHEDGDDGEETTGEHSRIPSVAARSYGGSLRSHRSLRGQSIRAGTWHPSGPASLDGRQPSGGGVAMTNSWSGPTGAAEPLQGGR